MNGISNALTGNSLLSMVDSVRRGADAPSVNPPSVNPKDAAKARAAAEDFEAFFVSHAFEDMFAGMDTDPMFGGGEAEQMFRSFLLQEYGKKVAASGGGVGVSSMVQQQLLQLQEVSK
jgi:Rod binding domain-containing protein